MKLIIVNKDDTYIGINNLTISNHQHINLIKDFATSFSLKCIPFPDITYLNKEEAIVIDILHAIKTNTTIEEDSVATKNDEYLKNIDDSIKVKNISISTSNENGTVEFDFDKNGNNIIPKETSTTVVLKCSNDILENNIGSYISPIVCIDYKLGKKTGTLNVPVMARGYSRSAQEIYAYKIDKVDIFNLYLKNLAKEDKE